MHSVVWDPRFACPSASFRVILQQHGNSRRINELQAGLTVTSYCPKTETCRAEPIVTIRTRLGSAVAAVLAFFDLPATVETYKDLSKLVSHELIRRLCYPDQSGMLMSGFTADNGRHRLSGRGSVVVLQQSPQTISLCHCPSLTDMRRIGADQLVVEALMIALRVIMRSELGHRPPNRALTE